MEGVPGLEERTAEDQPASFQCMASMALILLRHDSLVSVYILHISI